MKKLLISCNDCFAVYKFRLELIKVLKKDFRVYVVAGFDAYTRLLKKENIDVRLIDINKTGKSFIQDIKLYFTYKKIIKEIRPDIIINYTVKPHLYTTLAAKKKLKVINVVTGLSSILTEKSFKSKLVIFLYRIIARKVDHYVFLNNDDYDFFVNGNIIKNEYSIIKGEGVNLDNFYPDVDFSQPLTFIYIGRLVKEKGIIEYLEAARAIKNRFPKVRFLVAGDFYHKRSSISRDLMQKYEKEGIIKYLGYCPDINEILRYVHCVVLPSYREGMPISLIEGLASKKVAIAARAVGSKDVIIEGFNGFLANIKSSYDLSCKMEQYIFSGDKEQMHKNALASSKQYDVNNTIAAMKRIINTV